MRGLPAGAGQRSWRLVVAATAAVGLAAAACAPPSLERALPTRPGINVLVVTFDALRADRLGAYGYERPVSPNLDAFAAEAVLFEAARVAGQATPTSFAAAFTGSYPHRVFRDWVLRSEVTLAELFRRAGYRTGALLHNIQLLRKRGFHPGFDNYRLMPHDGEAALTAAVLDWLGDNGDGPFFLWAHYISPHGPYEYAPVAEHLYTPGYRGPYAAASDIAVNPTTAADLARYRELYDGEIFAVDALFGKLMEGLNGLGLLDDTLIVVSADHGEELGERDVFGHKTLFEEVWRVPLLIRHPDRPRGVRTGVPYSNVDLLPTLAGIAGLEAPGGLDGLDARRAERRERPTLGIAMTNADRYAAAIAAGSDKLIVHCPRGGTPPELLLFDLATDPGEARNLASERPEAARDLLDAMKDALGGHPCAVIHGATREADPTEGLDERTVRELEALGYVG